MKIEHLEEFIVFARHQSFSRAAEELYISQPTLSTHIRNLEREIGFDLVIRSNRPNLTPAGLAFLGRCQEIVDKYYQAISEGRIAAASLPPARILDNERSFALYRLAALIKDVPYTLVNTEDNVSVWQAFDQDRVDFGLILDYSTIDELAEQAKENKIEAIRVGVAKVGISMMKDHPLANKKASLSKTYTIIRSASPQVRTMTISSRLPPGLFGLKNLLSSDLIP